jgi:hypothetical protein
LITKAPNSAPLLSWGNARAKLRCLHSCGAVLHDSIEFELPHSTRRIDFPLFGRDHRNTESVVLVELKQWSNENVGDCSSEGNVILDCEILRRGVS